MKKAIKYYAINFANPERQPKQPKGYYNTSAEYSLRLLRNLKRGEALGYFRDVTFINL